MDRRDRNDLLIHIGRLLFFIEILLEKVDSETYEEQRMFLESLDLQLDDILRRFKP